MDNNSIFQDHQTPTDQFSLISDGILPFLGQQMPFEEPIMEEEIEMEFEDHFHENLAEKLTEGKLDEIATQILEGIEQDKKSRQGWIEAEIKGMKYLGFKPEERKELPFASACQAFDTTFSNALLKFYATIRPELFPDEGPAGTKIKGYSSDIKQQKANAQKDALNYYLTEMDRDYYPDRERLLMYLGLVGCGFTKTYQDPITNYPVARFIDPRNFIINNDCVSILSSTRITHEQELNRKEYKLRMLSGFYRDIEIPDLEEGDESQKSPVKQYINRQEGIDLDTYEKKYLYTVYESHVDLDDVESNSDQDKKNSLQRPYIVSICKRSKKVLSIYRNWKEEDQTYKRKECFTQFNFIPGFGIYGLGLIHLIGSNAIVQTSILRQLIDAGTYRNFPGGLMRRGLRIEENNILPGPGDFINIETGDLPIRDCVMTFPYQEPSLVLKDLLNDLTQKTENLVNTVEAQIAEGNPNAPVGTTLALLESSTKFQSAVFSSLRKSLGNELTLIADIFKNNMGDNPFSFTFMGREAFLTKDDFDDDIMVVSNSDPKLTTSAQRIIHAEATIRMAQTAPQLHNMWEVYKDYYSSTGKSDEEIARILPPQQQAIPLDPVTENMNAMTGKPLITAMWQDHPSHMMVHMAELQNPNITDQARQSLSAHIQEHQSSQYLIDMQTAMGMQMPPIQMLQDPQVQNEIAMRAAEIKQQQMMQQQEQMQAQQPIDPNQVMMADIAQRQQEAQYKHEDARLKAETEAYKAQMDFEKEKMKIEADKEMTTDKIEKDILLGEMKTQKL